MNIFHVLGVNYEVFHSRMLHWLWSPTGDHGGGERFWQPMRELLGIGSSPGVQIDNEVKIDVPMQQRWRLADLLIRAGDLLILVENKVDPAYQDALQIADEIEGGKRLAAQEGRRFVFLLIAPGPMSAELANLIADNNGVFLPWSDLLNQLKTVSTTDLEPFVAESVRQYIEFSTRPTKTNTSASDKVIRQSEQAIRGILEGFAFGTELTAIDVWAQFTAHFPDHVAALDARWAGSKQYSAKNWFASKLKRIAAAKDLIEDTGGWQTCSDTEWGFPKVRVYRRLASR